MGKQICTNVMSCRVVSCRVVSCRVVSCHVASVQVGFGGIASSVRQAAAESASRPLPVFRLEELQKAGLILPRRTQPFPDPRMIAPTTRLPPFPPLSANERPLLPIVVPLASIASVPSRPQTDWPDSDTPPSYDSFPISY
jgi:hypothetical protein